MAGYARTIARHGRLVRRGLLIVAVGVGALGLESLPSAAAAKDGAASSPASESSAPNTRRAERAAARAEATVPPVAVPPPVEAPPPVPAHAHRGPLDTHAPPPAPPAPPLRAGAGTAPSSHGAGHTSPAAHARRREERSGQPTTTGAVTDTVEASESSSAANAVVLARGQKKGTGKKEKTKAKEKENRKEKGKKKSTPPAEEAGEDPAEESSGGATLTKGKGSVDVLAPTQPTAVAASVSAVAATTPPTPAGGTGTASIGSLAAVAKAQPNSGASAARSARSKRGARKRSQHGTGAAVSTAAATRTPLVSSQAGADANTRPAQALAKHAHKPSTQPAIVKTITRLVGVVPTPIRILILALGVLALGLGVRSLFSGVRTRRLVRQRGELLEDVGALQAALLPVAPRRLGPVATSVAYRPADGPGAGGDFYDVFALADGRVAVIVGDVSGHGREALPHTALLRFTVRAYLEAGLTPGKALQTAGNVLERQLAGSFATVVAAIYHPRERTLTYASAGHPPPVVLGERATEGGVEAISPVTSCSAPPVGAGMRTGTRQTVVSVPGPARLCFHTDGVTEARIADELFGAERLTELLAGLDAEADASVLLDRVAEQSDARPDDMAACLLRVQDGAGLPSIALEQLELDREAAANPRVERFLLDCGVAPAAAELLLRGVRGRLEHAETVLLELELGDGEPVVSLHDDNIIHTAALAAASAS